MLSVRITKEIIEHSPGPNKSVSRRQRYTGNGLKRIDIRSITSESDYSNESYRRFSDDNGVTWSDWEDVHTGEYIVKGQDEISVGKPSYGIYNPVHNHYVSINMQRIFDGGHKNAYRLYWQEAKRGFHDHSFLYTSSDSINWSEGQLIKYEPGADYVEEKWNDPEYLWNNDAYIGSNLQILENGDILFSIGANIKACCDILHLDVNEVFPSCPDIMKGLIVIRGIWNKETNRYDLFNSKPVVINDLKSSRCVDEPLVFRLDTGRIIAIFRGSNVQSKNWNTRIEKGAPGHKWYCYSDDGGKTFTDPVPWHYETCEVFFSPATISSFYKSSKTQKLYWIGNITGPDAYGNSPRYPLVMAEVEQKQGLLLKDTLTVIDDYHPLTDSPNMQLSNFDLLEDRLTGKLEIYITRLGANIKDFWKSDAYKYTIEFI